MNEEMDIGYGALANAIIVQALKDYRNGSDVRKSEVKEFINSEWFNSLTNLDSDIIIKECERIDREELCTKN